LTKLFEDNTLALYKKQNNKMKKLLIFGSLLLSICSVKSQSNTFPASGSAGIGTLSPIKSLDIRVATPGDGINIKSSSQSAGIHLTGATSGTNVGHAWSFYSLGNGDGWCGAGGLAIHDATGDASWPRLIIDPYGKIGIGGITTMSAQLHIQTPDNTLGGIELDYNNTDSWGYASLIKVKNDVTKAFTINRVSGGTETTVFQIWGNGNVNTKRLYSEEIVVTTSAIGTYWPDYVFKKNYKLMPILELEKYIKKNHHLPHIPSAAEVKKDGLSVFEINKSLVEKVEELSLYIIELKKEIDTINKKLNAK